MVDPENAKTWTKEYVLSHRADCLLSLREVNLLAIHYIEERKYFAACVSLEALLNGLTVMQNSGKYGDLLSHLSLYSFAEAELAAFADPAGVVNETKDFKGGQTLQQARQALVKTAIGGFEDARDFAKSAQMKRCADRILSDLKAGVPPSQIRQSYTPDFPEDVLENLLEIDDRFFVPQIGRHAPDRCFYLDKDRLILTKRLDPRGVSPPPSSRPRGRARGKKAPPDFDGWIEQNDWDEEELERAYRRVKRRRNIYGALLLFPPLGVLLLPFWLRAVYLTKALYYRDFDVDFNILTKLVLLLYGLPTLYIYPLAMGAVIKWSNWGMGLGGKKAWALHIAVLSALLLLLLRALVFADIPRSLPGGTGGVDAASEEASLPGRWYSVSLSCEESSLAPDGLTFDYYHFKDDGTCDHALLHYRRSDEGLAAFQTCWQQDAAYFFQETYATDAEGRLSICAEGAPPEGFFENSEFARTYSYTFLNGGLLLSRDDQALYHRTDLGRDGAEQLIAGLSEQAWQLAGRWSTARRNENSEIETVDYTFNADGSFILSSFVYLHAAYAPGLGEGEQGWFVAPMGHPATYGTYTFDGKNLTLVILSCDVVGSDVWTAWTEVHSVGGDLRDTLELDGERYAFYDSTMDKEAVWDAIGVDYSAG